MRASGAHGLDYIVSVTVSAFLTTENKFFPTSGLLRIVEVAVTEFILTGLL